MTNQIARLIFACPISLILLLTSGIATADHGGGIHPNLNLTVPATSTGNYAVTWTGKSGNSLQEKVNGGSYSNVYTGNGGSKSFTNKAAGTYTYRVYFRQYRPRRGWVNKYTLPKTVVVSSGPPTTPGAIQGPSSDTDGTFVLTWTGATGATSYALQRNRNGGAWSIIQTTSATLRSESGLAVGTYNYRVKACNSGGCSANSATKVVNVSPPLPATIQTPQSAAPFSDPGASATSDAIGSTAGNFRVAENGLATYSIPLSIPEGTAGVKPTLSLNYSGSTQNGIAGIGWSIGGLSGISRCRQTLAQDAQSKGITFTNEDRFCLDGQRLLMVEGASYGAANSVYKTEIQSGATVTARLTEYGGPGYFEVKREDGSISYYGRTNTNTGGNARLKTASNQVLTWGIREYRDSVGNSIWFEYEAGISAQRIQNVMYAYGSAAGPGTYNARVEFVYESRNDRLVSYVGGHKFANDKRLTRIRALSTSNKIVREYALDYGYEKLSRLQTVQECANGVCLANKTRFDWNRPDSATHLRSNTPLTLETGSAYGVLGSQMADINGDGRLDMVWFYGAPGSTQVIPRLKYALSTGTGFAAKNFDNGSSTVTYPIRYNNSDPSLIVPIDYNADGRQDLAIYDRGSSKWKIHLAKLASDGSWELAATPITGLPFSKDTTDFVDINADGLVDAVEWWPGDSHTGVGGPGVNHYHAHYLQKKQFEPISSPTYYEFGPATVISINVKMRKLDDDKRIGGAPDFDGDGQVDLLQYGWEGGNRNGKEVLKAYTQIGSGGQTFANLMTGEVPYLMFPNDAHVADLNSDGLTDVIYGYKSDPVTKVGYKIRLSNGVSFETPQFLAVGDVDFVQTADWNSDGHTDLVWRDERSSHKLVISYWNPLIQTFDSPVLLANLPGGDYESASVADINGDGVGDLVHIAPSGSSTVATAKIRYESSSQTSPVANVAANRIRKITNGLGAETAITFEPLSTSDHYDRLNTSTTERQRQCIDDFPGEPGFCFYVYVSVADPVAFYTALNSPLSVPGDHHTLGNEQYGEVMPTLEMAGPFYVVTDVSGSAPVAGSQPGSINASATTSISYRYREGKLQAGGRGFLGFMQLTTIDNQTRVETTTRYRQDWPFVGMPVSTGTKSGARNLSISTTDWEILEWSSTFENAQKNFGSEAAGPVHVVQTGSLQQTYALASNGASQGSKIGSVETSTTYDSEANAKLIIVKTMDGNGTVAKKVTTDNKYIEGSFPLSEARLRSTVVTTSGGTLLDLRRESSFTYHSGTPNAKRSHYGLLATETIEPYVARFTVTTTHSYDDWGNRDRSKIVGGGETRCDVDVVDYDNLGRYVDVGKDCLGRTISVVTERNAFGQVTQQDNYVGLTDTVTSRSRYGAFGRPYYSHSDVGSSTTTNLSTSTLNCPASSVVKATTRDAGGAEKQVCTDVLGRTVRELSKAFDGSWNAVDTEYDGVGRVKRKSEPHNLSSPAPGAPFWTELHYDLLGRVIYSTLPDGSTGSVTFTGSATASTTITYNDKNQTKTEVTNVLGHLVDAYRGVNGDRRYGKTHYEYDHQGNLILVRDNAGYETTAKFDNLGRKEWVDDPDKSPGAAKWTYEYSHFGELKRQTDAKGQTRAMAYDGLGRMRTRVDKTASGAIDASATWVYDTAPYGLGQLDYVQDIKSGYHKAVLYDSYGRADEVVTSMAGGVYYEKTTYDQYGRVFQSFDAAGGYDADDFGTVNSYNAHGYLQSIGDALGHSGVPRTIYQQVNSMNARGQVTSESRGITSSLPQGAAKVFYAYHYKSGRADTIKAYDKNNFEIQDLEYDWDTVGNLTSRQERSGTKNLSESFGYDNLNRLTNYGIPTARKTVTYDSQHLGNIKNKTGVSGSYLYGNNTNAGHHAVTYFNGSAYTYDDNGNNETGGGRTITYSTFDKPTSISKGGHTTKFVYGPDRSRFFREDKNASGTTTTLYVGNVEIVNLPNGNQERRRYIAGAAIETAVFRGGSENSRTTRYVFNDHLGSLDVMTNDQGAIQQEHSFNAWGERRGGVDWTLPISLANIALLTNVTDRGFTGHEMLDEVGLIHMNGRIYDPFMGRFVQADSFVQDPTNSQSLNRYSYVWNNPLNKTDPSGYWVMDVLRFIIQGFAKPAAAVAINSARAGASPQDVMRAYLASASFSAIAGVFSDAGFIGNPFADRIFGYGVAGGITTVMQGGKFGHGFRDSIARSLLSAAAQSASSRTRGSTRLVVRAVAGGTISAMSGGKFMNGALTAAFDQMASNDASEETLQNQRFVTGKTPGNWINDPLDEYLTMDEAAVAAAHAVDFATTGSKVLGDQSSYASYVIEHTRYRLTLYGLIKSYYYSYTYPSKERDITGLSKPPRNSVAWVYGEQAKTYRNSPSMLKLPTEETYQRLWEERLVGYYVTNDYSVRKFAQLGISPKTVRSCRTIIGDPIPGC